MQVSDFFRPVPKDYKDPDEETFNPKYVYMRFIIIINIIIINIIIIIIIIIILVTISGRTTLISPLLMMAMTVNTTTKKLTVEMHTTLSSSSNSTNRNNSNKTHTHMGSTTSHVVPAVRWVRAWCCFCCLHPISTSIYNRMM